MKLTDAYFEWNYSFLSEYFVLCLYYPMYVSMYVRKMFVIIVFFPVLGVVVLLLLYLHVYYPNKG